VFLCFGSRRSLGGGWGRKSMGRAGGRSFGRARGSGVRVSLGEAGGRATAGEEIEVKEIRKKDDMREVPVPKHMKSLVLKILLVCPSF
jgi:hypothetical protein